MQTYMHQWKYKDEHIRGVIEGRTEHNRERVLRAAVSAFGGELKSFYFSLGEYDGVAIAEHKDENHALACLMAIFGHGQLKSLKTTLLLKPEQHAAALSLVHEARIGAKRP